MVKPTNNTLSQEILPWLDLLNDQHDEMLAKTIELAEINSGSLNRNGVNEVLEKLLKLTSDLSENYERISCLLYTSPSPRDRQQSRMPSSA